MVPREGIRTFRPLKPSIESALSRNQKEENISKANNESKYENSQENSGKTAFHSAANNNHFNLCQVIIEQLQNKNPGDSLRLTTPLHYAALRGHFKICKLIMKILNQSAINKS